jgi:hypothetical protein
MKKIISTLVVTILLLQLNAQNATNLIKITFSNDYDDTYHLALIMYSPTGKNTTKVSNIAPKENKVYEVEKGTEIYIANWKEEAYAMKGNDIKTTGAKPYLTVQKTDANKTIKLSTIQNTEKVTLVKDTITLQDITNIIGTFKLDLRPTPTSEPYYKDFKFTKITGKVFDGEFYGYPFNGGYLNIDWDKIYFGFTTADQSGTYFHSGYIEGNFIYGTTLNETRKFILPWHGVKVK